MAGAAKYFTVPSPVGFAHVDTSHRHLEHQLAASAPAAAEELIAALEPDVICLQETKVPDELFPAEGPAQLGFRMSVPRHEGLQRRGDPVAPADRAA